MSDTEPTTTTTKSQPVPAKKTTNVMGRMLSVLVLAAAVGLGFVSWQQQQSIQTLQDSYQTLQAAGSQSETLQQQQQKIAAQLSNLEMREQSTEKAAADLLAGQQQFVSAQQQAQMGMQQQLQLANSGLSEQATKLAQLSGAVGKVSELLASDGQQALRTQILAEALGMLQIAELRLQASQEVSVAVSLLRNADALLAQLAEPSVAVLRGQLAEDLSVLAAVNTVDIAKLYQQLGDVIVAQNRLTPAANTTATSMQVSESGPAAIATDYSWLNKTLNYVSQYFVVTRRDEVVTPLLTPEQDWLIHKSIELQLRQAQLGVLNGDQAVFELALRDANTAIESSLNGANKAQVLSDLLALQEITLRPRLPSLAARISSLQQLQQTANVKSGSL